MPLRLLLSGPCQETVSILRALLDRALQAEIRGIALCFRTREGRDVVFLTGIFRARPEAALVAAERMRQRAMFQLDLFT